MKNITEEIENILNEYSKWCAHCYDEENHPIRPKSEMYRNKATLKLENLFKKFKRRKT